MPGSLESDSLCVTAKLTFSAWKGIINLKDLQAQNMLSSLNCHSGGLQLLFEKTEHWEMAQSSWGVEAQASSATPEEYLVVVGPEHCLSYSEKVGKFKSSFEFVDFVESQDQHMRGMSKWQAHVVDQHQDFESSKD